MWRTRLRPREWVGFSSGAGRSLWHGITASSRACRSGRSPIVSVARRLPSRRTSTTRLVLTKGLRIARALTLGHAVQHLRQAWGSDARPGHGTTPRGATRPPLPRPGGSVSVVAGPPCVPRKAGATEKRGTDPLSGIAGLIAARPAFADSRVLGTDRDDDERSAPAERPGAGEKHVAPPEQVRHLP